MKNAQVGERLKAYRKLYRMTQNELADKIGKANSTLRNWESGRTVVQGILQVRAIADSLNVSVEWLRGEIPLDDVRVSKSADGDDSTNPVAHVVNRDVTYEYVNYSEVINPEDYEITEVEAPNMQIVKVGDEVVFSKLADPQLHLIIDKVEYDGNGEKIRESGTFVRILMKPRKKP